MKNIIYHAYFIDDPLKLKRWFPQVHTQGYYHHHTLEFKPKNGDNIEIGKKVSIEIIGRLTTDKIDALLIRGVNTSNKFPHITLSTADGVKPYESNEEFKKYPNKIILFTTHMFIEATEGYFDGGRDIKEVSTKLKSLIKQ